MYNGEDSFIKYIIGIEDKPLFIERKKGSSLAVVLGDLQGVVFEGTLYTLEDEVRNFIYKNLFKAVRVNEIDTKALSICYDAISGRNMSVEHMLQLLLDVLEQTKISDNGKGCEVTLVSKNNKESSLYITSEYILLNNNVYEAKSLVKELTPVLKITEAVHGSRLSPTVEAIATIVRSSRSPNLKLACLRTLCS